MTKKQADQEAKKIFLESIKKADSIKEEAKRNGTWKPGLDANNALFDELNKETKEKLKKLSELVEE